MDARDRQALIDVLSVLDRALGYPIDSEATKRLSPELRLLHPGVPWRAMAGMRDVLIHAYDQVDLEEVWMAYQRFPEIRRHVDAILNQS
jgi:uncharacterized protein with HEPN domain